MSEHDKADVDRLKAEIVELRKKVSDRERTIRELMIQVDTLRKSEEAHIARNPWKRRAYPLPGSPTYKTPGEGDY
jgi:predicted RNase H-like nuclease (RuvC/YqgF family)